MSFDPYHAWLGIPAAEQPPHHYRLLGLQALEGDDKVIDHAADRVMLHLRTLTGGPNGALSQKLLNEVAAARACLVDPERKAKYDQQLRAKLPTAAPQAPAQVEYRQVLVPVHVPVPYPVQQPLRPMPIPQPPEYAMQSAPPPVSQPPAYEESSPAAAPIVLGGMSSSRRSGRRRSGNGTLAVVGMVKLLLGGLGGLSIAILLVWVIARSDPFGLFEPMPSKATASAAKKTKTVVVTKQPATGTSETSPTTPATPPTPTDTTGGQPATTPTSTTTTEPAPTPPADPMPQPVDPPPVRPMPAIPVAIAQPAADSRHQPPSSDQQQAKLAELKELYKTEFDNGAKPAGREAFAQFLLDTADKLKSDPAAQFVLLREAYNRLLTAKDYITASEIVDRLDRDYALDPYKLRLHVLKDASANAKLPSDRLGIIHCAMELVEHAIRQQRISDATELSRIVDGQARTLSDGQLRTKATAMKLEVDRLAEQWGPVERARKTLATTPDDADAVLIDGRYRCLVDGDWAGGLPLLARSQHPQLGPAAQQDQAGPNGTIGAAVLGDNWYEIARSSTDLHGFYIRARHWYRQAAASADGLDKVRIQQRIEQIEAMNLPKRLLEESPSPPTTTLPSFFAMFARTPAFDPVDLFRLVNPQALQTGGWSPAGNGTTGIYSKTNAAYARVPALVPLPREYQVRIDVRRPSRVRGGADVTDVARGPFVVGLVGPKGPFLAVIDWPVPADGFVSFLNIADAKSADDNPTVRKLSSPLIPVPEGGFGFGGPPPRSSSVVCQVRRRGVTVLVDGIEACKFEGDLSRLSLPKEWSVGNNQALFLGSHLCHYDVDRWTLEPLPADSTAASPPPGFAPPPAFPQPIPQN